MDRPRKAHLVHTVRQARDIAAASVSSAPAYPNLAALRGAGVLDQARRYAKLLFAAGAAAGLATGCQAPECAPTRFGEIEAHTPPALTAVGDFRLKDAAEQMGIGFGVMPHPVSIPMAGAMPAIYIPPTPPDPDGGTDADGGTAGTDPAPVPDPLDTAEPTS